MICKYCGSQIAPGEILCPSCGESTVKTICEGGNGFWDIVGQEQNRDESTSVKERVIIKMLPLKRTVLTCAVLCILSALCLIFSIISSVSVKRSVKRLEADFNSFSLLENQIRVPKEPLDLEKSTFVNTVPTPTAESVQVTTDIIFGQEKNTESAESFPTEIPAIKTEPTEDKETDSMDNGIELEQKNPEKNRPWWKFKKGA